MRYPEFEHLDLMVDLRNRFAPCYRNPDGSMFYIEPGFYKAIQSIKAVYPDRYPETIRAIETLATRNKVTVFAADEDAVMVDLTGDFTVLTPSDIIDFLDLSIEDKSRGSDYGD